MDLASDSQASSPVVVGELGVQTWREAELRTPFARGHPVGVFRDV